jgi:LCP family protein required for cell wall assembly
MSDPFEHQIDGWNGLIQSPGLDETQPIVSRRPRRRRAGFRRLIVLGFLLGVLIYAGLTWPSRFNLLILGIDRTPPGTALGRSDTMILSTFLPGKPYVGVLSIPRDLWVSIPGYGMNRINAAHFFAENDQQGSGPPLAEETVRTNFGVAVDAYVRIQFDGLRKFVDSLGGVPIELEVAVGVLTPGEHLLNGEMALAFLRSREGSDDFFRMQHGQQFIRAVLERLRQPAVWPRIPLALVELIGSLDSDVPLWQWPRLGFALLRVGANGLDGRIINRTMATGFVTEGGAQVLAPAWDQINPVLLEMFGQ